MHAAAGLAAAVAAIELVPRAIERVEIWLLAVALICGSFASVGIARLSRAISTRLPSKRMRASTIGAYVAIGVDLVTDGLMTGSGAAVAASLGLLLALSQIVGNLPGGFAIAASFRAAAVPRRQRLVMLSAYPMLPVVGAAVGYLALRDAGNFATGTTLAFLAGLLLTATIEEIVPEADKPGAPRRISSPAFAGGFVLLLLLSAYLSS
ncbi:zinc transporter, ZIP family [Qipengyuania nanhaisediminis]|uniref:Zinc transporter, ZIP family n=1 Tax=Qipengyuania nanhaisediminis TaxID=604088 RepID=A0A1I5NYS2_9SPHN|nr:zinc transporter, ZIP family [Qipengyuania nanhaisediminis]